MARLGREHRIQKRPFGSYRGSSKELSISKSSFGSFLKPNYSQMWKGIKIALCSKILPGVRRLSSRFSTVVPGDMLPLQRHSLIIPALPSLLLLWLAIGFV
ncbi:hypothetical protein PVK06_016354 [Gossypium arboreum]|uniref:Uncharacterized protein n=1 Tax=Gossypium arboreum TaxID=29729 RepID=A0ABR0Q0J3_GOSAR|nr:hypothetical protein PVK06_016354 [Gossypium arboreum]